MPSNLEYKKQVEASIADLKKQLEPLESGTMTFGVLSAGEQPWKDLTREAIDRNRRAMCRYERILEAINRRLLP